MTENGITPGAAEIAKMSKDIALYLGIHHKEGYFNYTDDRRRRR